MKIHSATIIPSNDHKLFVDTLYVKNNLSYFRKYKGFSQQSLADWVGVSRNTICSIERYEYYPGIKTALLISKVLEEPLENIFYLD